MPLFVSSSRIIITEPRTVHSKGDIFMSTKENKNKLRNNTKENTNENDIPHVNSKFAIVVITVFLAIIILPAIVWGALQIANLYNPEIMQSLDFDTGENRAKAKFPEKFDPQTFTADVEAWYNDHLPFRSVLYSTQHNVEDIMEAPYENHLRPWLLNVFHGGTPSDVLGGEDIPNAFETSGDSEGTGETETLPEFEIDDSNSNTCRHVYASVSTVVKESTCSEWGVLGYQCTLCDYIGNKEYTQKKAHDYVSNIENLPLCGETYEETVTCDVCHESETRSAVKKHIIGKKLAVNKASYTDYGYTLIKCKDCSGEYKIELSNKLYDTSYFPTIFRGDKVIEGRNQWLFYRLDNSGDYFTGANLLSDAELEEYAAILQQLNELCVNHGIKLLVAVWPNKEQVYSEYMPSDFKIETEYKRVERLTDYINTYTDVSMIYPLSELIAAKPYWENYYKLDTHWNKAGAFIGLQAMYKELGLKTTDLINLPVKETSDEWSDLRGLGGLSRNEYFGGKEYEITYKKNVQLLAYEGDKRDNNSTWHTISTADNDLNFVMIADSYRINMNPFLEKDFKECFVTNRSNLNGTSASKIYNAVKNADILVIAAVERYDYQNIEVAKKLIKVLSD